MNLKEQVCSLELSKKLKKLGVKQESLFCYQPIENEKESVWPRKFNLNEFCEPSEDGRVAAFTVAELVDMLPYIIKLDYGEPFNFFRLRIEKSIFVKNIEQETFTSMYIANYYCDTTNVEGEEAWLVRLLLQNNIHDENMANCLATLLIYLLENKLIKP